MRLYLCLSAALLTATLLASCGGDEEMGFAELVELGHQYSSIGEFDSGAATFTRALEIDSSSVEAHRGYQNATMRIPDGRQKIVERYSELAKKNPENPLYQYLFGRVTADDELSLRAFLRAVKIDPDFYWAHVGLAANYVEKELYENAIREYEIAVGLEPSSPSLVWLAETYVQMDQIEKAEQAAKTAVTSLEDQDYIDEAYSLLFNIERKTNDSEGMIQVARDMLQEVEDPWVLNLASWTFVEDEANLDLAVELAEKGIENSSPEAFRQKYTVAKDDWIESNSSVYLSYLYDTLGWAHYLRNDFSNAVDALRFAVEHSDNVSTEIWTHLARALSAKGDNQEAFEVLLEILSQEMNPEVRKLAAEFYKQEHGSMDGFDEEIQLARTRNAVPASNFTLFTADETPLSLMDYKDKVILLNFWFPTCTYCGAEFPHIEELYRKYKDEGLVVVAVESKGDMEGAKQLFEKEGYTFPYVHDTKSVHKNLYNVTGFPTTFLIGRMGMVRYKHIGFFKGMEEMLENEIRELLAEEPLPAS
jgi:tetratricopeptide (TPR) repeat protein